MIQRRFRLKVIAGAIALAFVLGVPVAASETVTQTLTGGDRSASISGASLSSLSYSHEAQLSNGTITISVDDSTGSGAGWNVTVHSSDFSDGGRLIDASNFAITSAGEPVQIAGQTISETGGPNVPGASATGPLNTPRKVLSADAGYGVGSYSQQLEVELTVPGQTLTGTYQATLTVDIMAGP